MTIAAAYLTSEGVVLGADSTTTISLGIPGGPSGVAQLFSHAQKVFEIGDRSNLGLSTWGAGIVGETSHRTLAARLAEELEKEEPCTVEMAAKKLTHLVQEAFDASSGSPEGAGYYLGGWNDADHLPACYRLFVPPEGEPEIRKMGIGEANFSGAPKFFTRIFLGYDPQLKTNLHSQLKAKFGQDNDQFETVFEQAFNQAATPLLAAGFKDLPIREAIDYIHAYLHITVKAYKFQFGPPVCGGPIEVAFVSSDRLFRWVCHKPFDSAIRAEEVACDE